MGINELIAQGSTRVPAWNLFETERNALVNQGLRQELQYRPENQNWLRKSREMEVEKFGLQKERAAQEKEAWAQEQEMRPIETDMKKRQYLSIVADWLDPDNYEQSRDHLIKVNKIPEQWLPKADYFKSDDPEFNNYAFRVWQNRVKSGAIAPIEKAKLGQKEREIGLRERELDIEEQKLTQPKEVSKTELGKMIGEYNALPSGDPMRKVYEQKFAGNGLKMKFDENGKLVEITQGPLGAGGGGMTPTTKTSVQTKLFNSREQLSRLDLIERDFKPEYQQLGPRLSAAWTGIKAGLGKDVPPEQQTFLTDFSKYKRKSIENINMYIKEITGAQMSELEANRIRQAQPDPGEHWYSGDDPISFKAKLDDVIMSTKMAIARYQWYLTKGMTDDQAKDLINRDSAIPLGSMQDVIQERGKDIETELKDSKLTPNQLKGTVKLRLQKEFGL